MGNKTKVFTGTQIKDVRFLVLKSALKLEILGMHRRGPSAYSIIKKELGLKGSKQKVYDQLCNLIKGA